MFLYFFETIIIILLAAMIIMQIFVPLIRGTKTWPIFGEEGRLERVLKHVRQRMAEGRLRRKINAAKRRDRIKIVK